VITEERLEGGVRGSCEGLAGMLEQVETFADRDCAFYMDLARRGATPVHFIANAVWAEVAALLEARCSRIFASAFPDQFHKVPSWRAHSVLDVPEMLCRTTRL
jgi:hypothetical protein